MNHQDIYDRRAAYSKTRLESLRTRIAALPQLETFPTLTIFAAGSYARLEASEYSDIDMFFLSAGTKDDVPEPKTNALRLFGGVIEIADQLRFPKFSNDSEYLVVLHTRDIVDHLGSRTDDHENYFTARMLLLLESYCLYADEVFAGVVADIVSTYFKDYPDHTQTFQATFLLNDICRFWKTLLLNYENKRKVREEDAPPDVIEAKKTRQRVRNFKIKYSRMTTCFASIAALGSHMAPVTEEQVVAITRLTPRERLLSIPTRVPAAKDAVRLVLDRYEWFLEMTGLPTELLEARFSDSQKRTDMFRSASEYGDSMYSLIYRIDAAEPRLRLLRNLVI